DSSTKTVWAQSSIVNAHEKSRNRNHCIIGIRSKDRETVSSVLWVLKPCLQTMCQSGQRSPLYADHESQAHLRQGFAASFMLNFERVGSYLQSRSFVASAFDTSSVRTKNWHQIGPLAPFREESWTEPHLIVWKVRGDQKTNGGANFLNQRSEPDFLTAP
ncbi:MAG: hypothetical protein RIS70_4386, partial [Planctomycetota bacterium]